jgi:hypothetical protein
MHMSRNFVRNTLSAAIAVAGFAAVGPHAQAALLIDVRAAGGTPKSITVTAGQVINLEVYGVVTGAAGNATADEGLQSFQGSFVSTLTGAGSAVGNFSTFTASSPFNAPSQAGKLQDLNSQAGIDVGSFNAVVPDDVKSVATDYVAGRSAAMTNGATVNPEFLLGTLTWTVTNVVANGQTTLNFVPRLASATPGAPLNTGAAWREDGANKNPTSGTFGAGAPVTINVTAVPEPTAVGLLGLAAAGLLARRRERDAANA